MLTIKNLGLSCLLLLLALLGVGSAQAATRTLQGVPYSQTDNTSTLPLISPAGTAVGDVLLAQVVGARDTIITKANGWTELSAAAGLIAVSVKNPNGLQQRIYYRVAATAGEMSYDFAAKNSNSHFSAGVILAVTGADSAKPICGTGVQSGNGLGAVAPNIQAQPPTCPIGSQRLAFFANNDASVTLALRLDDGASRGSSAVAGSGATGEALVSSYYAMTAETNGGQQNGTLSKENDWTGASVIVNPAVPTLGKTVSAPVVAVGSNPMFTLTATNPTAYDLIDVELTDVIPTGLDYVTHVTYSGTASVSGQTLTWTIPKLAAKSSAELTLVVKPTQAGTFTNTVTAPGATSASVVIQVMPSSYVHYKMDEAVGAWSGAAGSVTDSGALGLSGHVRPGTDATNTVAPNPTIASQHPSVQLGFCNAGNFSGSAVVESPSNKFFSFQNTLSASAWIYPKGTPGTKPYKDSEYFSIVSNDVNYEFHLDKNNHLYWWWTDTKGVEHSLTSAGTITPKKWTHVAVTMDATAAVKRERIYINGVQDSATTNWSGTLATNTCPFYIGGDIDTDPNRKVCNLISKRNFNGMIDEAKIYNFELSADQVKNDMIYGRRCDGTFDHIRIEHDGVASVCSPERVTVKACVDAACSDLYDGAVTVTLAPKGWVGGDTFTFSRITTRYLGKGSAGNVTLATSNASPVPSSVTRCFKGATETCVLNFGDASCGFDAVEPGQAPEGRIFTKLADRLFKIDVLALKVGTKTIDTGSLASVGIDLVDASAVACPTGTGLNTSQALVFSAENEGRLPVSFTYPKAAKVVKVRIKQGNSAPACSTNDFTIRPQGFSSIDSSANADSAGLSPSNAPALKTGSVFTLNADTNKAGYDGIPKVNPELLEWALTGATGGLVARKIDGKPLDEEDPKYQEMRRNFTTKATVSSGNGASGKFVYDEVGYFRFKENGVYDDTFLSESGSDDIAGGDCRVGIISNDPDADGKYGCNFGNGAPSNYFGRFIPDHFAVPAPVFKPGCGAGSFSYMDQPFVLTATIEARNPADGVTKNYTGDFARAVVGHQMENDNSGTDIEKVNVRLGGLGAPAWNSGAYSFVATKFTRLANPDGPDGPYDALDIGLSVADLDALPENPGPYLKVRDMDSSKVACTADSSGQSTAGDVCTAMKIVPAARMRFGRLRLDNAYGSELLDLTLSLQAQYWNGTFWALNVDDTCTSGFLKETGVARSGYSGSLSAANFGADHVLGFASDGVAKWKLALKKPDAGTNGSVDLCLDLGADPAGGVVCAAATSLDMPWLQGRWPPGTTYANDPWAKVTFGTYKTLRKVIHRREVF